MADDWKQIIVLDTETTGVSSPSKNQILTIDATRVQKKVDENGTVSFDIDPNTFHGEVARQSWSIIEEEALRVTGIDIDAWKGESEEEVLGKLVGWITKSFGSGYKLLCGYNVIFDKRFLHFMFERSYQFKWTNAFSYRYVDVLQLVLWCHLLGIIEEPPNFKLETVAKFLGVWEQGAHSSDVDVAMTIHIMEELNRRLNVQKSI